MTENHDLGVEVRTGEIVVTMPGTGYVMTYIKPVYFSILISKPFKWKRDYSEAPITPAEFKKQADAAAKVKARELGWID